jgi:sucrose-6-phosphate hydrolase SacC (GH32 family)
MEWISVKERLPKKDETSNGSILVVNMKRGSNSVFLAQYAESEECFLHTDPKVTVGILGDYCPVEITHWLPIPKLPKK